MKMLKTVMIIMLVSILWSDHMFTTTSLVPVDTFYAYDKHLPLNVETKVVKNLPSATFYEIFFDSINNQRVSGLLMVPKIGLKKYPVILYLHGSGMSRELPDIAVPIIAQKGFAVFSISAFYTNERKPQGKSLTSGYFLENRQGIIQTITDYRRGLDALEKREDIDTTRVGIIGLSLGTIQGATLFGLDDRIKVAAFAVGGGDLELMAKKSILLSHFFDFSKLNYNIIDQFKTLAAPVDPINFANRNKGRPVIMINGRKDEIVPPVCAQKLYEKFEEPKHIIWYDGGHVPPMDVIMMLAKKALSWFENYLIPEKLPKVSNNTPPVLLELAVKPDKITQGEAIRIEAKAEDKDKNIIFVKAYIEGDDAEVLLQDNGQGGDRKAGDGIFTARAPISYNSRTGETKITAIAVDYNGDTSSPLSSFVFISPYIPPPGSKAPEIVRINIPKKIKIGSKERVEVEVVDENNDVERVELNIMQFGVPIVLNRVENTNIFRYDFEIPELDNLAQTGTYDVLITARDKTRLTSERKIIQVIVEK